MTRFLNTEAEATTVKAITHFSNREAQVCKPSVLGKVPHQVGHRSVQERYYMISKGAKFSALTQCNRHQQQPGAFHMWLYPFLGSVVIHRLLISWKGQELPCAFSSLFKGKSLSVIYQGLQESLGLGCLQPFPCREMRTLTHLRIEALAAFDSCTHISEKRHSHSLLRGNA